MRTRLVTSAIAVLALGSIALPTVADARGVHVRAVRLQDRCDPATFNAALGDGACIPHGNQKTITFAKFLETLNPIDFGDPKWNNHPDDFDIRVGDQLSVTVRGGEFHTFTEVDEFGAGCIDDLNIPLGLSGGPTPEECFAPDGILATTGVAPNGLSTLTIGGLSAGTHLFMCEIHPWMTSVVNVEDD
jgi:plastocyanin